MFTPGLILTIQTDHGTANNIRFRYILLVETLQLNRRLSQSLRRHKMAKRYMFKEREEKHHQENDDDDDYGRNSGGNREEERVCGKKSLPTE